MALRMHFAPPLAFRLVKAMLCVYMTSIEIWPDHMAVSPKLIARRTFRPPNIDEL